MEIVEFLVDNDYTVKLDPKRAIKITVKVREISKGSPCIVIPEDFELGEPQNSFISPIEIKKE